MLVLKDAPFDKRDAHLVAIAGSCVDCPKRTGHNKLLFSDLGKQDACTDPSCYQAKVDAHVAKTIAAKPKLVQISTGYGSQQEGSAIVPRDKYVEIAPEKPKDKEQANGPSTRPANSPPRPSSRTASTRAKSARFAPIPLAPSITRRSSSRNADASFKAEQEKQRREAGDCQHHRHPRPCAIAAAVPVRLMKRDLLFVAERLAAVAGRKPSGRSLPVSTASRRQRKRLLRQAFAAYLRRAEESELGSVVVEYHHPRRRPGTATGAAGCGAAYKVDTDAIALKVKQEFAAKEKAKKEPKPVAKVVAKVKKAA